MVATGLFSLTLAFGVFVGGVASTSASQGDCNYGCPYWHCWTFGSPSPGCTGDCGVWEDWNYFGSNDFCELCLMGICRVETYDPVIGCFDCHGTPIQQCVFCII